MAGHHRDLAVLVLRMTIEGLTRPYTIAMAVTVAGARLVLTGLLIELPEMTGDIATNTAQEEVAAVLLTHTILVIMTEAVTATLAIGSAHYLDLMNPRIMVTTIPDILMTIGGGTHMMSTSVGGVRVLQTIMVQNVCGLRLRLRLLHDPRSRFLRENQPRSGLLG